MKVGIIGASGQLGSDLASVFEGSGHEVMRFNHNDIEISEIDSIYNAIKDTKPQLLINTAAYHHVERCEEDPGKSFLINGTGAKNLAEVCSASGVFLIHISTDYVFDGGKKAPYLETDLPCPLNVYGNSKLSGEYFIQAGCEKYLIIRTSGLYGLHPCRAKGGLNFVELMLKLARERDNIRVVDDEVLTPTFTAELARQIERLAKGRLTGICHVTSEGACSWYEFASAIFSAANIQTNLEKAAPGEFKAAVKRPSYSVLENRMLKDNGLNVMNDWRSGLQEYLKLR